MSLSAPVIRLLAVVLCLMTGLGMVWSMLAVYASSLGAGSTMVGLLLACFGGARLIVNLPAGLLSERFGRRPAMLVGLVILALGTFVAAATRSVPILLVCLLVQGAGSSAFITTALAAVADLGTPETRLRDMSAYQGATLIGISIGPGLGGLAAAAWGYGGPFLLQGIMALLAIAVLISAPLPLARASKPPGASAPSSAAPPLVATLVGLAVITYGVFFARVASNWVLLPLIAKTSLGMSLTTIGLMLTAGAIANLATLPLTGIAARRFGRNAIIYLANAATVGALLLLAGAHSAPLLWVTALLLGGTSGLAAPTLSAIAADAAPPGRLGAAMGLMRTMTDLAIVTGPIAVGLVADALGLGYRGGLGAASLVLAATTLVFAITARRRTV
jgi:DHA1 family multidrug resistance protein-like MFS transporter